MTGARWVLFDIGGVLELVDDTWQKQWWHRWSGRIEYARSLRGRARTAILSNSADGAREEEERRFRLSEIFDPICYSHEQGVNKPDPQAYLRALERLGAVPDEVFFIDDRTESIAGAAVVGIRGIRHRTNAETIAAIETFLGAPVEERHTSQTKMRASLRRESEERG